MTTDSLTDALAQRSPWRTWLGRLLLGGALTIIGLFTLLTPPGLWDKARLIGYALCHQLPERSFFFHEHQSPLCARCTGMYLGLLIGLIFLVARRRTHSARLPAAAITSVLIGFITIMGIDGVNSTIAIIPGAPQLYHTTNVHRIVTGSLCGLAMAWLFLPILNTAVWRLPSGEPTVRRWRELLLVVVLVVAIDWLVLTEANWLFYPITIMSIAGPLCLLSFMGAIIVLTTRNLANVVDRWRQLLAPLIVGAAFGLILITIMDLFRASVTSG